MGAAIGTEGLFGLNGHGAGAATGSDTGDEETKAAARAPEVAWADAVPAEQWDLYREAIASVRARGVPFMLGGAFALATYTGRLRNTKDLDLYIRPSDRDAVAEALADVGFDDYHGKLPYDRGWIYRSHRGDTIVDAIWAMANRRAELDESWFRHAVPITVRGEPLTALPPEELVWAKIYVMQRDRCDWTDILNVIHAVGPAMDWSRLTARMAGDVALLSGVLSVYAWLCPAEARGLPSEALALLPESARAALDLDGDRSPNGDAAGDAARHEQRVRYLDSRPWFVASPPRLSR
jgi:hypothetical protein